MATVHELVQEISNNTEMERAIDGTLESIDNPKTMEGEMEDLEEFIKAQEQLENKIGTNKNKTKEEIFNENLGKLDAEDRQNLLEYLGKKIQKEMKFTTMTDKEKLRERLKQKKHELRLQRSSYESRIKEMEKSYDKNMEDLIKKCNIAS